MDSGVGVWTILMVILFVALVAQLIANYLSSRRSSRAEEEGPTKIITKIVCEKGDYSIEREFREGDFVGKIEGICPKCGSKLVIDLIYVVREQIRREHRL